MNPRPTGSVIVLDASRPAASSAPQTGDRFLALLRAREPNAGRWDLPGGFCDGWEHPEATAVREAREELGVEVRLEAFVGMYVGSYEFQGELLPVLDSFWLATIVSGEITLDPSEASDFTWADIANPPRMAFATMDAALHDVVVRWMSSRLVC